jgi:type IV secretion system protein TrbL
MSDLNVIDQFMSSFTRYIDGGFGLLGGHVRALTTILVGIDVTLAGLFWSLGGADDILARFLRKVLYVGAFAFILNDFANLSTLIFTSFANLGLLAGGGTVSPGDLLKPGRLAATGFDAAWPLLDQASKMMGFTTFFDNFLTIIVLLIAWLLVVIAFFILAIQLFVTILEFKLTSLAGFVLVPFALWNRTSFLAERVLGSVIGSGIKVMVLAVIVAIGSGFFSEFVSALKGQDPDIGQAMSLVLASLSLLGLGLFGPGIATGLVSGAPQLGAGAAVGTTAFAAGGAALGGGAAMAAARVTSGTGLAAVRAATAMSGSSVGGGGGMPSSSATGSAQGLEAGHPPATSGMGQTQGGHAAGATRHAGHSGGPAIEGMPEWAQRFQGRQQARQARQALMQTVREGDRGGAGAHPDITEREE